MSPQVVMSCSHPPPSSCVPREHLAQRGQGAHHGECPADYPHDVAEVCERIQPLIPSFDFKGVRFVKVVSRAGAPSDLVQCALQPLRTLLYEHFNCTKQNNPSGLHLLVRGGRVRAAHTAGTAKIYLSNSPDSVLEVGSAAQDAARALPPAAAFRSACRGASLQGIAP